MITPEDAAIKLMENGLFDEVFQALENKHIEVFKTCDVDDVYNVKADLASLYELKRGILALAQSSAIEGRMNNVNRRKR